MLAQLQGQLIPETDTDDTGAGRIVLDVDLILQAPRLEWCWAACCAMILCAQGKSIDIYTVAAAVLGDPPPDDAASPSVVLDHFSLPYLETNDQGAARLNPESLRIQVIEGCRPAEVQWEYPDGSGHIGLVTGYDSTNDWWRLLDPLVGRGWVTYEYLEYYGYKAKWTNTFYQIGAELGTRA